MADRYWVGGTANWDATAGSKWALTSGGAGGQAVPTASDDVYFDAASGAVTVTVGAATANCLTMTCTGFTGTIAGAAGIQAVGNVTLVAGMGFTHTGGIGWITASSSATFISAGKTIATVIIGTATFSPTVIHSFPTRRSSDHRKSVV